MTLGEKIQKLRKQSGLSQEALAQKMAVTRQTVSKWELNQSMPDVDFIAQLSELFQVSADYLIKEEITTPDAVPAPKQPFRLTRKMKRHVLAALSALELAAAWVCLICDYFTSDHLSWSLITAASLAAAWFVLLPLFTAGDKVVFKTLLAVSAVPVPLLAVLAALLKEKLVFTLGSSIAGICIVDIWVIYGIFLGFRGKWWRALGFALLALLPVPILITHITAWFLPQSSVDSASDLFNSGLTLILALVCFGVDNLRGKKQENP